MNYIELINNVLREVNEPIISSISGATGFDKFVADSVNKAISDIELHYMEWPWKHSEGTATTVPGQSLYDFSTDFRQVDRESFTLEPQNIVSNGTFASAITSWTDSSTGTGSSSHTTDGNGRLRLAGGASGVGGAYQALSTVVATTYRVYVRTVTGDVTVNVGTTIGGTEVTTKTLAIGNKGDGRFHEFNFAATATTTYIEFTSSTNANHDVDIVTIFEDLDPVELDELSIDEWRDRWFEEDKLRTPGSYSVPERISFTKDDKYRLDPSPDKGTYTINYDYWTVPTVLSSSSDSPAMPARFHHTITARTRYYVHKLRSDYKAMAIEKKEYDDALDSMRTEVINENDYFYSV